MSVSSVFQTMSYPTILNNENLYYDWLQKVDKNKYLITCDDKGLNKAKEAVRTNPWCRPDQRSTLLFNLAKTVESQKELFASVEAATTKKPLSRTKERDVPELISHLYNAAHAVALCPNNWTPHGVVGILLEKTNSPSLCLSMPLGPALAMGNAVFLCGLQQNFHTALLLVQTALQIGFPSGILNLAVDVPDDQIQSFDLIIESGAKCKMEIFIPHMWRSNNRPKAIVTESADLASAAHGVIQLASFNAPMSCYSGACVLVQENIFDSFWTELSSAVQKLLPLSSVFANSGDFCFLLDNSVQAEERNALICAAKKQGAELVWPASCSPSEGKHGPVLVRGVGPTNPLVQRNLTAADSQIVWVQSFRHNKEAIALANSSPAAESVSIWGEHTSCLLEIARDIQAENVWINTQNIIDTVENLNTNLFLSQVEAKNVPCTCKLNLKVTSFLSSLNSAVTNARNALKKWQDIGSESRSHQLFSLAEFIRSQQKSLENIRSQGEDINCILKSVRYLFESASQTTIQSPKSMMKSATSAKCWNWILPYGVIVALLPKDNGIFSSLMASLGAALAAGNTFIAITDDSKAARICNQVLSNSGIQEGVVNVLHVHYFEIPLGDLLKPDIDAAWILNEYSKTDVDVQGTEERKRKFPVSYLNLSHYNWAADLSHEPLREWFHRQAITNKKVWFDFVV